MGRGWLIAIAGTTGLLALLGGETWAQPTGFALERLEPAPATDAFFAASSPTVEGHRRLTAGILADFAHSPLVLYSTIDDREVGPIVSARLNLRLQVAFSLASRLLIELEAPFAVLNSGDSPVSPRGTRFASPAGAAAGDLRVGARLRLFSAAGDRLHLALASALWLPTGRRAEYTGDGKVRATVMGIAGGRLRDRVLWTSNLGFRARRETVLANNVVAKEVFLAAAAGLLLASSRVLVGPEVWATGPLTDRADFLAARSSAAEGLLGVHYRGQSVRLGVAAGTGFTQAMGTPDARLVARFVYSPADPEPPRPVPVSAPPTPTDRDGDTILDPDDACPLVPGVRHDDPRKNGCPEDSDRDGDGVLDAEDACQFVAGVRDPDPKKNGCPPDRDGDGIVDAEDACPREKGPPDPDPSKNGCPTLVRVTDREIVILKKIHFEFRKARIMPDSSELLAQVAQVLKEHPEIGQVAIEGHTDALGAAEFNLRLSQQRADAVRTWLVDAGVEAGRLQAKGLGETRPIASNETEEGRERNRRVEFLILQGPVRP
jgi:OmpA-OmpF porin, OOP family